MPQNRRLVETGWRPPVRWKNWPAWNCIRPCVVPTMPCPFSAPALHFNSLPGWLFKPERSSSVPAAISVSFTPKFWRPHLSSSINPPTTTRGSASSSKCVAIGTPMFAPSQRRYCTPSRRTSGSQSRNWAATAAASVESWHWRKRLSDSSRTSKSGPKAAPSTSGISSAGMWCDEDTMFRTAWIDFSRWVILPVLQAAGWPLGRVETH